MNTLKNKMMKAMLLAFTVLTLLISGCGSNDDADAVNAAILPTKIELKAKDGKKAEIEEGVTQINLTTIFDIKFTPENTADKTISWSLKSADQSKADLTASGILKPKQVGMVTVVVTSKAKNTVTGKIPFSILGSLTKLEITKPKELVVKVGEPITLTTTIKPSDATVTYSISPALPTGITLDESTGVISGSATVTTAAVKYTLTATAVGNYRGTATTNVRFQIGKETLTGITVPSSSEASPLIFKAGEQIASTAEITTMPENVPVTYSIAPSLPAGLNLNENTGIISGTPTAMVAATKYTITATPTSLDAYKGTGTASIYIKVKGKFEGTITANDLKPFVYKGDDAGTIASFTIDQSAVTVTYSVSPDLPTGLTLDESTGVISGTPTVVAVATDYTVTATATGDYYGTATTTINVEVKGKTVLTGITVPSSSEASPLIFKAGEEIASTAEMRL